MDYSLLRPGQLYNHFPHNNELTTKSGLCNLIHNICDNKSEAYYPRSYDFSIKTQIQGFELDFEETSVLNFLHKNVNIFMKVNYKLL